MMDHRSESQALTLLEVGIRCLDCGLAPVPNVRPPGAPLREVSSSPGTRLYCRSTRLLGWTGPSNPACAAAGAPVAAQMPFLRNKERDG